MTVRNYDIIEKYKEKAVHILFGSNEYLFDLKTSLQIIEECRENKFPIMGYDILSICEDGVREEGVCLYSESKIKVGHWTVAKNGVLEWARKENIAFIWFIDRNNLVETDY